MSDFFINYLTFVIDSCTMVFKSRFWITYKIIDAINYILHYYKIENMQTSVTI